MQHTSELGKKGTSGSSRDGKREFAKAQNRKSTSKPNSKVDEKSTEDISIHTQSDKEVFDDDSPAQISEYL